jgi:Spy/CpxP family protein refolding chaperone
MKKLILVALLVVGITTFAQVKSEERKEKFTPEQRVDFQVKKMTKDLNLNEKQAEQIKALITKEIQKRESKRAKMKAKREEQTKPSKEEMESRKTEMKASQDTTKAEMKKILTTDQYAKWELKQEERKEKMVERMKEKQNNKL